MIKRPPQIVPADEARDLYAEWAASQRVRACVFKNLHLCLWFVEIYVHGQVQTWNLFATHAHAVAWAEQEMAERWRKVL